MAGVKFVEGIPTVKRGRPVDPKVIETRDALAKRPGKWAEVMTTPDAATARKFAKAIDRDDTFEASTRAVDGGYAVYARKIEDAPTAE